MKTSFKYWIASLMLILINHSCEKWIDPGINTDPNSPADVGMESLVPFIEADIAFKMLGSIEITGYQSIWLQQLDGIDRQALSVSNYVFDPLDIVFIFNEAYSEILMDAKVLGKKAVEQGSPHNEGLAHVLTAFTLGQLTDAWNDIPWSEALKGDTILQPVYDSQQSIYQAIQTMLDRAIEVFSVAEDPIGIKGDYLYNGDAEMWGKAAHALKARYYLHLSKITGTEAYEKVLEHVQLAFTGNKDDLQFNFGVGETESNPLYQFMNERSNVRMGAFFVDMMKAKNDPRLPVFATTDESGNYSGSAPGQANGAASKPGTAFASPDAPSYLITYVEMLFTKAEALLKTGADETEVKSVLLDAVSASLAKFNVTDQAWLDAYASHIDSLTGESLFEEIMLQKYIATFYQPEVYHSWRRTGYPVIPPNPVGATGEIPRRFPYSIYEVVYNHNVPKGISITDRVWWDE